MRRRLLALILGLVAACAADPAGAPATATPLTSSPRALLPALDEGECRSGNDCPLGQACVLADHRSGTCQTPGATADGTVIPDPAEGTGVDAGPGGRPLPPLGLLSGDAARPGRR